MKAIYKFTLDAGRLGYLHGIFCEETGTVAEVIERGGELYFGEVLGKHSDIACDVDADCFDFVTDDQSAVEAFERYGLAHGYNPLRYIRDDEDDEGGS